MEQLRSYLEKKKITVVEFAILIGEHRTSVQRYLSGKRKPRDKIKLKIQEVTGEEVPITSWY